MSDVINDTTAACDVVAGLLWKKKITDLVLAWQLLQLKGESDALH